MAGINSWVIRDVPKATFVDVVTRKPLFYLVDVKASTISNTAETVYARGGSGNPKIVGFSSNREARLELSNAVFDNAALAMMTGNNVLKGVKAVQQRDVITVNTNAATLNFTPANGTGAIVALFKMEPDGTHGTEITYTASTVATGQYSRAAKNLTFFSGDLPNNSKIIAYYNTNTDVSAQTITISSNKFAQGFGIILDAIVKSPYDQKDYKAQINVTAAKAEDAWEISMSADGEPSEHSIPIEILRPSNGTDDMYTITLFDGSLLT